MAKAGFQNGAGSLAPNRNISGVRTGMIPVPVKGLPGGSGKGRPASVSGDVYGSNIQGALKAGFAEGKTPQAD